MKTIAIAITIVLGGIGGYALWRTTSTSRPIAIAPSDNPTSVGSTSSTQAATHTGTPSPVAPPNAKAPGRRLMFPGWEDVVIGDVPPVDARQKCSVELFDGSKFTKCHACRSASLPLPCIELVSQNGDPVQSVSAELPQDESEAKNVTKALRDAWGPAKTSRHNNVVDMDCWELDGYSAGLATNYYDASIIDPNDPNAIMPRAQHPRRVVLISKSRCM
jgi:hypothetical protein